MKSFFTSAGKYIKFFRRDGLISRTKCYCLKIEYGQTVAHKGAATCLEVIREE